MATPTRWGLVWLVTLAGAVAAFQIGKMPASLPAFRDDLAGRSGWLPPASSRR